MRTSDSGRIPPADADQMPEGRDPNAALGGRGPSYRRASAARRRDRPAIRRPGAVRAPPARGPAARNRQSPGDRRNEATRARHQHQQHLAGRARPRLAGRRAHLRAAVLFRIPDPGAGPEPADDRPAAPPPKRANHAALRALARESVKSEASRIAESLRSDLAGAEHLMIGIMVRRFFSWPTANPLA